MAIRKFDLKYITFQFKTLNEVLKVWSHNVNAREICFKFVNCIISLKIFHILIYIVLKIRQIIL